MPQVKVHLHLLQGRGLAVKDVQSSDPFVRIYEDGTLGIDDYLFQSRCKSETVHPKFNEKFQFYLNATNTERILRGDLVNIVLCVFDDDAMHGEDPLGTVRIPLKLDMSTPDANNEWYTIEAGEGDFCCEKASGELNVRISLEQTNEPID
jgi:Ca2+-dependent lipid-binding protein